eukprot:scaffold11002_cov74-Isochrysis_galbana.AAC.1
MPQRDPFHSTCCSAAVLTRQSVPRPATYPNRRPTLPFSTRMSLTIWRRRREAGSGAGWVFLARAQALAARGFGTAPGRRRPPHLGDQKGHGSVGGQAEQLPNRNQVEAREQQGQRDPPYGVPRTRWSVAQRLERLRRRCQCRCTLERPCGCKVRQEPAGLAAARAAEQLLAWVNRTSSDGASSSSGIRGMLSMVSESRCANMSGVR